MPDEDCYRRIGDINALEIRLRLLEDKNLHLSHGQDHHELEIDKLRTSDSDMVISIKMVAKSLDSFKDLFKVGFQIIAGFFSTVVLLIGAFWVYSHDLDQRYSPKVKQLVDNSEIQKQANLSNSAKLNEVKSVSIEAKKDVAEQSETIQQQIDKLEKLKQEIVEMKNLKVIQASKPGKKKK